MLNIVILCGGVGTRLWPLSRKKLPKQFLKLTNSGYSLIQETVLRAKKLNPNSITIVVNKAYDFLVQQHLDEIDAKDYTIISEPVSRNTAAAILAGISHLESSSNVLVLTSDHIWEDKKFVTTIEEGLTLINQSKIIFFGIKPTHPETGYGYIKTSGNQFVKFVEKPDIETAKLYLDSGNYLWNSGIFMFNKETVVEKFKTFVPNMYNLVEESYHKATISKVSKILNEELFRQIENISVDYAIMENCDTGFVIPYDGFWSDIGSFSAIHDYVEKDESGNYTNPDHISLNTENCYISSKNRLVATIGIKDTVIVDTPDVLLVCNKNMTQNVKDLQSSLKDRVELTDHLTEHRPWGYYTNLAGDDYSGYKVKRIVVYPGKKLSLQTHSKRSEHWVFIKGVAKVRVGDDYHILRKNQSVYIPIGVKHRVENIGSENVQFIETQVGEYLGEDDIVRYEDDWDRT